MLTYVVPTCFQEIFFFFWLCWNSDPELTRLPGWWWRVACSSHRTQWTMLRDCREAGRSYDSFYFLLRSKNYGSQFILITVHSTLLTIPWDRNFPSFIETHKLGRHDFLTKGKFKGGNFWITHVFVSIVDM